MAFWGQTTSPNPDDLTGGSSGTSQGTGGLLSSHGDFKTITLRGKLAALKGWGSLRMQLGSPVSGRQRCFASCYHQSGPTAASWEAPRPSPAPWSTPAVPPVFVSEVEAKPISREMTFTSYLAHQLRAQGFKQLKCPCAVEGLFIQWDVKRTKCVSSS